MKYPQLVSMPSAVQDWLEEQLEARGIDAVVYTRYIVSLLKRDTLDFTDDTITLEPNKSKASRRTHGSKRGRRDECWDVSECEQLKRSAAVECLMSASDQKCGIEKLVDDLCVKLKEIEGENKQSSVYLELSESTSHGLEVLMPSQSPRDQAQKYYAAFPPLTSKNLSSRVPEPSSVWSSGKRVLSDVFGNSRSENTAQDKAVEPQIWEEDKENVLKHNVGNNGTWMEVGRVKDRFSGVKSCRREAEFAWSMNESYDELNSLMGDKLSSDELPRRLYQRQADVDHEIVKPTLEDRNLAQLIAKFDESIEALWSPSDEEPPVNLLQLLSSPSPVDQVPANSFIPCGTNITSSIWSDCSDIAAETSGTEDMLDNKPDGKKYESLFNTLEKPASEETNVEWSKSDALPSFFTSGESFAKSYTLGDFSHNVTGPKWSDFKDSSTMGSCSFGKAIPDSFGQSFMALNHSKEDSSFTEVIPKSAAEERRCELDAMMEGMRTDDGRFEENSMKVEDDEDLLTSAKTHFKPIKQEAAAESHGRYADGTTFVIPDGLEVLPFKRSRSGTLFLESNREKYWEFKEKESFNCNTAEFVPKFRVYRNEKCCQTEEVGREEFFFPEDEKLVESIDRKEACGDWTWGAGGSEPWPDDAWGSACGSTAGVDDRLRQELSQDGEQLLSDLSYAQRLFLGAGWEEEPSAQKMQCVSPDEARSVDEFFSKCLLNVLPKTILLSADLEAKWTMNERPFNAQVNSKYRKRRHSGSQRVAAHEPMHLDVTVRAQTSCVRGLACPQFILDHARTLRPVTL